MTGRSPVRRAFGGSKVLICATGFRLEINRVIMLTLIIVVGWDS